jgi:hypothetical protein
MSRKRCTCCGLTKAHADFSKNAQNADGLAYYCRLCNAEKQREWKHANPEKVAEWKADYLKRQRRQKNKKRDRDWK